MIYDAKLMLGARAFQARIVRFRTHCVLAVFKTSCETYAFCLETFFAVRVICDVGHAIRGELTG